MPRASAAAFSGSGFGPASGGHTTAAIVSPAASRPRSTSSAKAACPTRRMRIAGSGFQMLREELLQPAPRVLGGGLLIRRALVAEEAVLRAGIDDDLDRLAVAPGLGLLVVTDRATLPAAPVEIRRQRDIALARDPARHVLDVVVEAERLLDHEHAGRARAVLRPRQEGGHLAARRRHLDRLRLDVHAGFTSWRGGSLPPGYRRGPLPFNAVAGSGRLPLTRDARAA